MPAQYFHISTITLVKFIGVILLLGLLFIIRDILMALLFAIIVASAIEPAVEWLKIRRIPRILSVVIIYLALGVLFFLGIYLIVPLLFEEFQNISLTFPTLQAKFFSGLEDTGLHILPFLGDSFQNLLKIPTDFLRGLGGGVIDFASAIFGGIFTFILIIIFSFYIAAQEKGIESFLRLLTPLRHEAYIIDLWDRSQKKLGRWLRAQLLLGAVVGVLIFFGLTFLGVPHALFFAILAGAFELIPVVGPILAAVPAVVTALAASSLTGILVIALYVVVQQLESHVIVPVVMRKAIGLSPLVVVLALLIGAKIGGIFGILLSVPLTAILTEFINDWDKKKRALLPE